MSLLKLDISILIVSYNTFEYLRDCLSSIFLSKTNYTYEVIVTDNNSKDNTKELVSVFPNVKWIFNNYNYGFSVAMNQAYRISDGRYVLSFNPDAEMYEDTIHKAIEYLDNNPTVGKIGFTNVYREQEIIPHHTFDRYNIPHLVKFFRREVIEPKKEPFEVDWIFGTGIVIRRSLLSTEKLYDEKTFLFWEEFWLSNFVKKSGYEIHIVPDIKILHHTSVTMKVPDESRIYWIRLLSLSHEYIIRKSYFGKLNATLNILLMLLDNAVFYVGLNMKSFFTTRDPARNIEILDHKVRFMANFWILTHNEKSISKIDKSASKFFNQGVYPEYPPLTINILKNSC